MGLVMLGSRSAAAMSDMISVRFFLVQWFFEMPNDFFLLVCSRNATREDSTRVVRGFGLHHVWTNGGSGRYDRDSVARQGSFAASFGRVYVGVGVLRHWEYGSCSPSVTRGSKYIFA